MSEEERRSSLAAMAGGGRPHGDRDGNLGTGTQPDGAGYGDNFLPAGDTRTRPELRRVWGGYFFSPTGNPTGI
jgi:hypothetical protein